MGMIIPMSNREPNEALKELLAGGEPPELGPGPRKGVLPPQEIESTVKSALADRKLAPASFELACSLVLLWHDNLDASHTISQSVENADGSFVHAIMHRREPDYWNSKYWWRRVGKHPCFPEIARRVTTLLESRGERELLAKLVPGGEWDAFAFVNACEEAARDALAGWRELLREVQRIEFEVLLERFIGVPTRA